jgi:hypothetical protein
VRSVVEETQVAVGGVLHAVSVATYEQVPPLQVPEAAYVRRVLTSAQAAAGGVLHDVSVVP